MDELSTEQQIALRTRLRELVREHRTQTGAAAAVKKRVPGAAIAQATINSTINPPHKMGVRQFRSIEEYDGLEHGELVIQQRNKALMRFPNDPYPNRAFASYLALLDGIEEAAVNAIRTMVTPEADETTAMEWLERIATRAAGTGAKKPRQARTKSSDRLAVVRGGQASAKK